MSKQKPQPFNELLPIINNYTPTTVEDEKGQSKSDTREITFQVKNLFDLFVKDGLMTEKEGQYCTSKNFNSKSELTVHLGRYDQDAYDDNRQHIGNQLTIVFSTNGNAQTSQRSAGNGLNFGNLKPPN